jgi:proteasome alpha subunit
MDEQNYSVLGGSAEQVSETLKQQYEPGLSLGEALRLGASVLATGTDTLAADQLEVALLERSRPRRAFRRLKESDISELLGASSDAGSTDAG